MQTENLIAHQPVKIIAHPDEPARNAALIGQRGVFIEALDNDEAIVRFGALHYQWWRLPLAQLEALPLVWIGVDYGREAEFFGSAV